MKLSGRTGARFAYMDPTNAQEEEEMEPKEEHIKCRPSMPAGAPMNAIKAATGPESQVPKRVYGKTYRKENFPFHGRGSQSQEPPAWPGNAGNQVSGTS